MLASLSVWVRLPVRCHTEALPEALSLSLAYSGIIGCHWKCFHEVISELGEQDSRAVGPAVVYEAYLGPVRLARLKEPEDPIEGSLGSAGPAPTQVTDREGSKGNIIEGLETLSPKTDFF